VWVLAGTQSELDDALSQANQLKEQNKAIMDELSVLKAQMAGMVMSQELADAKVSIRAFICAKANRV
jgi:hypothetical protein